MVTKTNKTKTAAIRREDIALSDRDIINRYLGVNKFPCTMQSPLREDDIRPSFAMRERDGKVFWKDFGTGLCGDAISLMALIWNVTREEAMMKMKSDCGSPIPYAKLIRKYKGKIHTTGNSEITVKTRDWKKWDKEFWESFGIPLDFASWCNVFPISHAFFTHEENGVKLTATVPMDKYAYAYFEWKDGNTSIKLYQPYSKTMKWLSKHDASVWDLWKHAFLFAEKKSDKTVIITSSRKDAMCLWYNLGIPAMALQGEGYLPKPQVMQQVLDRFKTVYLWYDNDYTHTDGNPGQDNARKLIDMYPTLKNICIPSEYKSKDPSDLVKNHGVKVLKQIWKEQK